MCSREQLILFLFAGLLQGSTGMCVASLSPVERKKKGHAALRLAHTTGRLCQMSAAQSFHFPLSGLHCQRPHYSQDSSGNTGQQNLTFFFGTRGKIYNPNRTFNAEFKCVSSFSPSPTVCL